jgi:GTP 3',8-cyclase
LEDIIEAVRIAAVMGITKVRLTGGEPLMRRGIIYLVEKLAQIEGIDNLSMTTNGVMLEEYAAELKRVGLRRINISLDTIDADRFGEITNGGDVAKVLSGIDAAIAAELNPIKLNCVVKNSAQEKDAKLVKAYAAKKKLQVRFIHLMNLESGNFSIVEGGSGGDCVHCNRLRLLSNGDIRPCLFSDMAFNIRELGIKEALRQAIVCKPEKGTVCSEHWMCSLGG